MVEQDRYRDEVELRHYIHIAYEKAERLHVMIEDLFEYTRMSGGAPLSLQPVRVNDLISQLFVHYRQQMEDAGIELRMDIPEQPLTNYGEPIPEADLPHVFDRFYRVDRSRGDDVGGSGLGLAIARAIVEMHEGQIRVTSDRQSTHFIVDLPASS